MAGGQETAKHLFHLAGDFDCRVLVIEERHVEPAKCPHLVAEQPESNRADGAPNALVIDRVG